MRLSDYANIYLSAFKHLEDGLISRNFIVTGTVGAGITLLDAYPDDDQINKIVFRGDATGDDQEIILPVVTIEQAGPISRIAFELSSVENELRYPITLTIFAETHLQSFQIAGAIDDCFRKDEFTYYDYDQDFENPAVSGTLVIENYISTPVTFIDSPNKALKYGYDIVFDIIRLTN